MEIGEVYEKIGELIKEDPSVLKRPFYAMGTESTLRVFRNTPDGPIKSIGLEDSNYMEGYISEAENLLVSMGVKNFPERYMQYLVGMCENELPEDELEAFIKNSIAEINEAMSLSEDVQNPLNVKQISVDVVAHANWDGESIVKNMLENLGFEVLGTEQIDISEAYGYKTPLGQKITKAENLKKPANNQHVKDEKGLYK